MKNYTYPLWLAVLLFCTLYHVDVFSQTTIDSENFNSAWGIWNDGGSDCARRTYDYKPNSSASIRIRDNSGTYSAMTTDNLDLTPYTSVDFTFDFEATSMDSSEDFHVKFHDGSNWITIATYVKTSDFNNGTSYTKTISLSSSSYTFSSNSKFRIECSASSDNDTIHVDNVLIEGYTVASAPEMNILGNTIITIVDGSTTPSLTDKTDFGSVDFNSGSTVKTYIIENLGTVTLNIGTVSITGLNSADFSILTSPSATVAAGGNTTFSILFNPSSINLKIATVSIINDDSDENPYDFAIEGTGIQSFFDSDGDGVLDNIDVDDDNDGILDLTEENYCKSSNGNIVNYKFLNETFGTGTGRTTINTNNYTATTTYCYEDGIAGTDTAQCPSQSTWILDDGEYTVVSKITGTVASDPENIHGDLAWYNGKDHTTGDIDGRMAVFNASFATGVFYETTITGVLSNLPITYSFWALNIMAQSTFPSSILPDITVQFVDLSDNILATFNTGPFGRCTASTTDNSCSQGEWHQFTTSVNLGNVNAITVRFINNAPGGGGNDLALDDIVISQTLCDTDSDGIGDVFDLDSDNDGIPDVVEAGLGDYSEGKATLSNTSGWLDTNTNGMNDINESHITLDSDGDGTPNYIDLDSDNDSIFDVDESGAGNSANASFQNGDGDINGDGVGDGLDTDTVRKTDVDSNNIYEYFSDGILDVYDFHTGLSFNMAYGNTNQGIGHTYYVLDTDLDGTPDYIDLTSDGTTYDIANTLYASFDGDNDGIIDDTNDAEGDGIVDLFDTDDSNYGSPRDLDRKLHLYFDGRNDYAEDVSVINGWGEATIMTWIKIDPSAIGIQIIAGQTKFNLQLNSDKTITAYADGNSLTSGTALNTNQWIHVASTYSDTSKKFRLYINGLEASNIDIASALNTDSSSFTIGRQPGINFRYFHGYIDELRVFSKALSEDELRKMIYQEIENNGGTTRGSIIPSDITDFIDTSNITPLNWSSIERYFRMDTYKDDIIDDLTTTSIDSGSGAKIYNTKLIDVQSAPLPFVTQQSGSLPTAVSIAADGVNGNDAVTYDWSIVKILHDDVTYNGNQKHVGLIINQLDSGSNPIEFSVQNDSELNVSWYLKLDGTIDLEGESQLVQGADSELVTTSAGTIERDQQGTADMYTYNYWAAPVGIGNTISNNNSYKMTDVLNDGTNPAAPSAINFLTSGYNGSSGTPIGIADYWIWKYANQLDDDYASWQHVRSTGSLAPGEGFTMKGPADTGGAISTEQNYVFNGKPNNGDITLTLSAGNDYLVGNPYASAIDADEFILDNISDGAGRATSNIINGALYFWEHFASSTHNLAEYQGGYGTYTLMGGTTAISTDTRINATGVSGTKTPQQYIPVGQGFFVVADIGGSVTFKNSQRIFKTEATDPSVFMRTNGSKAKTSSPPTPVGDVDTRQKIRLMLDSPKGYHRQLLLGADINTSNSFDKGYDALLIENNKEDMFWNLDEKKCIIQATNNFDDNSVFPLGIIINQAGMTTIKIDELENIPESVDIFIYDKELNIFHDLNFYPYIINLPIGEHLDKFEIVLHNKSLSIEDSTLTGIDIHYSNAIKSIIIKNPTSKNISVIKMINLLGQEVFSTKEYGSKNYYEIKTKQFSSGTYVLTVVTDKGTAVKKVIVE